MPHDFSVYVPLEEENVQDKLEIFERSCRDVD